MSGNLYDEHPLMIDSGTFWRCDHGVTGFGTNMVWKGCADCARERHVDLAGDQLPQPDGLDSQLTAARTEIDRLLTLTSEQATEIAGKDKALAEANIWIESWTQVARERTEDLERQSVLLGKAKAALESAELLIRNGGTVPVAGETWKKVRAVLSELQLKGK